MKLPILSLLLCFTFGRATAIKASKETLARLNTQITNLLRTNSRLIGGFVRLSFHDCVPHCQTLKKKMLFDVGVENS